MKRPWKNINIQVVAGAEKSRGVVLMRVRGMWLSQHEGGEEGNRCHAPCVHVAVYGLNPRPVVLLHNVIFSGKDEFTVF